MNMMTFREQRMRALAGGQQVSKAFRAEAAGDVLELYFYDAIDSWGGYWGISAKDVIESLMGAGDVLIHMNSPGGEAIEALAIYSTLKQHPGTVTVRIEGMAASAASVVMLGADRVTIDPNALVMIHDAWGYTGGPEADVRKYADTLGLVSDNIANLYASKAAGDPESFRTLMREGETWYAGQAAVDAGLVDEVAEFAVSSGDGDVIGDNDDDELFVLARWDRSTVAAMYGGGVKAPRSDRSGRAGMSAAVPPAAADTTTADPLIPDWEKFRAALGGLKTA